MKAWVQLVVLGAAMHPWCFVGAQDPVPDFQLDFGIPCEDVGGAPGEVYVREIPCRLRTRDNPVEAVGASAWSIGFATEGVEIVDVTVEGTAAASIDDDPPGFVAADGFQLTRLVGSDIGDCSGRSAVVSVVLLSGSGQVTLPETGFATLVRFRVEGVFPGRTEGLPVRFEFLDGCRLDEATSVRNEIQWNGRGVVPSLESCELRLLGPRACPQEDAPLQVIFQTESVGQTAELFEAQVPTADPTEPAELELLPGSETLWAGIVSQLDTEGVQSWDLAIACEGDLRLTAATVRGTVAASFDDDPPGLRERGFEITTLVDPSLEFRETGRPQGQGAVSAVVLSMVLPVTLAPRGTATVLGLTIEGDEGQSGTLRCKPGLRGHGLPVSNVATVQGLTERFDCCQWVNVHFRTPSVPFHRGDVNDSGHINITDPVRLLQHLFLGAPPPDCMDAADFNDDAVVDISDAVGILQYKYLGSAPPPDPGPPPEACGPDPEPHAPGGCARYDSC